MVSGAAPPPITTRRATTPPNAAATTAKSYKGELVVRHLFELIEGTDWEPVVTAAIERDQQTAFDQVLPERSVRPAAADPPDSPRRQRQQDARPRDADCKDGVQRSHPVARDGVDEYEDAQRDGHDGHQQGNREQRLSRLRGRSGDEPQNRPDRPCTHNHERHQRRCDSIHQPEHHSRLPSRRCSSQAYLLTPSSPCVELDLRRLSKDAPHLGSASLQGGWIVMWRCCCSR